ncbi:MAG: hypothetical protein PVI06_18250 [Desulfobacterales bacterium]|jgi:hypothetical protein
MHNLRRCIAGRTVLLMLVFLFLQNCTGTVDFSMPLENSPPLEMIDPLPVELSPRLINLVETSETSRYRHELLVGNAIKSCFRYTYKPKGKLDLVDSQMSTTTSDTLSLKSNFACEYTLTVSLTTAGGKETVTAHGKAFSGLKPSEAAQYAVEYAVLDLYKKIESLLSE